MRARWRKKRTRRLKR
nr:Chain P, 60S ribosomal protein L41-A [Saccharomyces cerevisiae]